ncbi:MAG TPA: IPT/TIG domain-containing protein, partial [Pyrinomonadaceae bacterium]|nr:IPT/TIG domain-containing protein [Pyrinomonadaceae bacterium]
IQTAALTPLGAVAGTTFEGPGEGMAGFFVGVAPPDTTLAVGPNHIVAWVNSQYAVFNKSGTPLLPGNGFVDGNTLFTGMGNVCETTNRGDPILQYDRLADRWFLSQFAFNTSGSPPQKVAPYLQCIAVSTTNNPLGSYFRYTISFSSVSPSGFNDYGKLGVWPDAYYTSYNVFGGSPAGSNTGAGLCASDRTKMLAGDASATTLCAPIAFYAGGAGFLPADLDGSTLPTDLTQGGIFARYDFGGSLRLMKLKPNFAASTVTLTNGVGGGSGSFIDIPVGATTVACNGGAGTCIAQPGTTNLLDTLADRLMYRLAYRNRAGVDSLIVTHSVDPDGAGARSSAPRWYEIRSPFSATPTLFENATYDPGASGDRWMGSIAMDQFGNMLLGYSVVNAGTGLKPSIAVAGRLLSDPVNTLQAESTVMTGTGSQTGGLTRWGDYTTMQIDPTDDATFWFIGQYLAADGSFNWHTRIASYKFLTGPVIQPNGAATITSESLSPPNGAPDPTEQVTANFPLKNVGTVSTTNLVATLQTSGGVTAIPAGENQNYGVVAAGGATVSRSFTFRADGTCGATITATFQLQDGATNLGNVTYNFQLGVANVTTQTFSNAGAITINDVAPATPYPSNITVSGAPTTITNVTVKLNGFSHIFPEDVDVLLVSPTGRKMIVLSDAGEGGSSSNVNITLDDAATSALPASGGIPTGTYKPTNYSTVQDAFVTPAPAGPYLTPAPGGTDTLTSAFTGAAGGNPNGTWSLYVVDDLSGGTGSFAGGWSLTLVNTTYTCSGSTTLRIDTVSPKAGRTSGNQSITLTGAFSGLSTVTMGGVNAAWTGNTSTITVTTPAHAVGAVQIDLTPTAGSVYSKTNAFAYLPTVFTDDTIFAAVTIAKAQHIIELRQAVDAMRAVAGLTGAPWTDPTLSPTSTIIKAVHIQQLRTFLDDAATRLGYSTSPYADPTLSTGFLIKRIHIEELRQRIRAIAG